MDPPSFESLEVKAPGANGVGQLVLNRPTKSNAIDRGMWSSLQPALDWLVAAGARCIVVSGAGKNFCAGMDLASLMGELAPQQAGGSGSGSSSDQPGSSGNSGGSGGGAAGADGQFVFVLQDAMSAFERCPVPVVAAVHGACVGAGVDLVTACDIRLATADAAFCVKEADLAIVADMGTLQRLPALVGHGVASELALTARTFSGAEARELRLVSQAFPSQAALQAGALALARSVAAKSPLAVVGTKRVLLFQRDHSVADGLDYVATWNAGMLPQSADVAEVAAARAQRRPPLFARLFGRSRL